MNRTVRITIKDNDDPQGVFSFRTTRITVPENATSGKSRMVDLEVQRTKGTFGDVSVLVRTVGGGERWNPTLPSLKNAIAAKKREKNATIGTDYVELSTRVTFSVRFVSHLALCDFCVSFIILVPSPVLVRLFQSSLVASVLYDCVVIIKGSRPYTTRWTSEKGAA